MPQWRQLCYVVSIDAHRSHSQNKIGFVDGTIKPPSSTEKPAGYALWVRRDKMVLLWLLNSIELDLANGVVYVETSHEVWEDLRDRFSQGNAPNIFQIKDNCISFTKLNISFGILHKAERFVG